MWLIWLSLWGWFDLGRFYWKSSWGLDISPQFYSKPYIPGTGSDANILNFQNTFVSACDKIRQEIQGRKFLQKSNLNKISG